LAVFCSFTGLSSHSHQHAQGVTHSSSCLLACAAAVAQAGEVPFSPSALLLVGTLLIFGTFFCFKPSLSTLPSRAPPIA
jgi:hypothetical protein